MNIEERTLARHLFQNRIYKSDGQAFEDLFTAIMNYADENFRSIKPWGNIGDRKNDGYIENKGIFFQVFAPEDITQSYPTVVKKTENDFNKLIKQWNPVNEFYFVVNDKYKGVNADSEQCIKKIKSNHSLNESSFLTAKDLENKLFEIDEDQILTIVPFPDPKNISTLDYSVVSEVIEYISSKPLVEQKDNLNVPEWGEKIKFNGLSGGLEEKYLENGFFQIDTLDNYLKNNSSFLSQELKDRVRSEYLRLSEDYEGKELFWKLVNILCPNQRANYQRHVIVILSKYFETCDVFEEPDNASSC